MQIHQYKEHIILSISLIIIAQFGHSFQIGVFNGQLADPDCYSWLVRAAQLHESGSWFDGVLHRVDPPYGLEQHWTRPFDVLLLLGAWMLTPLLGFESALYSWGVVVSPLLQIFSVLVLIWGFGSIFNHRQLIFLVLGFIAQPAIFASFMVGRPDHHSLITFLFVLSFALIVYMLKEPERRLWGWGGGVASALGFWVCIEIGQFIILPVLASFSILWILKDRVFGSALFHYLGSLLLFSAFALLIQNGWDDFFRPEKDRISIIFLCFFGLVFLYGLAIHRFDFWNTIGRAAFACAAGPATVAIMQLVYPQFFSGSGDPTVYSQIRSGKLAQDLPVFTLQWPDGVLLFFYLAGIVVPTFVWLVYGVVAKKWWKKIVYIKNVDIYVRIAIFCAVSLFFYREYVDQARYVVYLEFIALLGYVVLIDSILKYLELRYEGSQKIFIVRPMIMFLMLTWVYFPMLFLPGSKLAEASKLDTVATGRYIHVLDKRSECNVMAAPEMGSVLLYFTDCNVYTFTNHRSKAGFRDWYYMMTAKNDDKAREIVQDRNVDMIMINKPLDTKYFANVQDGTFFERITEGDEPEWLKPVELSSSVRDVILIYEVSDLRSSEDMISLQ